MRPLKSVKSLLNVLLSIPYIQYEEAGNGPRDPRLATLVIPQTTHRRKRPTFNTVDLRSRYLNCRIRRYGDGPLLGRSFVLGGKIHHHNLSLQIRVGHSHQPASSIRQNTSIPPRRSIPRHWLRTWTIHCNVLPISIGSETFTLLPSVVLFDVFVGCVIHIGQVALVHGVRFGHLPRGRQMRLKAS